MGICRAFHKAGPDIEKAIDPVLVSIRGTANLFYFVDHRYFEHFGRTSNSAECAGWFSFVIWKVIVHILKLMRNLTGSQCNCFRKGTTYHSCEAVLNTL